MVSIVWACVRFVLYLVFVAGSCYTGLAAGSGTGLVVGLVLGVLLAAISESAYARRQETDRVIRAMDRARRGLPAEGRSRAGPVILAALVLVGLGYSRMRSRGYASPGELLGDVGSIASR